MKRIEPGPGQESVWDYPRPPRIEPEPRQVEVILGGATIAESVNAVRVLETSHPPGIYIPATDIDPAALVPTGRTSFCEWKGRAVYFDVIANGKRVPGAAWSYPEPTRGFEDLEGHVSFYPGGMDACYLSGERVIAQEGDFYGGWITSEIVGPFKGAAGTWGW